ncbi:MAG: ABC transporter permease [Blastocatellales bacterium]
MQTLWQDVRYGIRLLIKKPAFTIIAVMTLALGIGANTAIFSVVHAALLRPLPYEKPDQLMMIWERNQSRNLDRSQASPVTYCDWREQKQVFDKIAGWWYPQVNLTDTGSEPERVRTVDVTDGFFDVLGAKPMIGRGFQSGEDRPGGERLAVIGHALWQRRFNSDPNVYGKTITLDGRSFTVVGVMPAGFNYPNDTEVWCPLGWDPRQHSRNARFFEVVARLKDGVSPQQAQVEMNALSSRIAQENPQSNKDWTAAVVPLRDQLVGDFRLALLVLFVAVGLVLLIACANVANLMLARAGAREKEVAIRLAIGATRGRLVRQLLTESVLLALMGGVFGLLLAVWGTDVLLKVNPVEIPQLDDLKVNSQILGFTLGVSLLTGLIFGLIPALQSSRTDLNRTLKEGGRDSRSGGSRVRSALVVAEVAVALVLLVGAGLLLKSFARLQHIDPGFSPNNVLTFNLQLPVSSYRDWRQVPELYSQLIARLKALPGVQSADAAGFLPLEGGWPTKFLIYGQPAPLRGEEPVAQHRPVSESYFQTMGIQGLGGRQFDERDNADTPGVVIVNEALARRYFPNENPIGKRITTTARQYGPLGRVMPQSLEMEIVGLVGNEKNSSLNKTAEPAIYFSHRQFAYRSMNVVVRTTAEPMSLANAARNEVWAVDRNLPVSNIKTMEQRLGDSIARPRFSALLLGLFAALALILAAVGIYGVISYAVEQRTHEIGVRMAMGARATDILTLVVGQGLALSLAGVGVGIAGALGLTRLISGLLYGVTATDPLTFVGMPALLVAVALLACWIPARRATKVDPMIALRYE